ncbi:MAG: 50S ribosomal protein L25 [bacterium]|nr:50S ribosomal protein L25 [bacterium]
MELQVQKRVQVGKSAALRRTGLIPLELYGKGVENLHLTAPVKEFKKVLKEAGENTIVNAIFDGKKYPVIIHEVVRDGVSGDILNVDLYQIRMDEKIKLMVPLEFIGISLAIKEKNGLLVKSLQEVEVEALPMDVPHTLQVDISKITEIGQSLYVKDLDMPKAVRAVFAPETVVATVTAKVTEEEELAKQQEAGAGLDTVKVETEEKKAERDAAKVVAEAGAATGEAPKAEKKAEKK